MGDHHIRVPYALYLRAGRKDICPQNSDQGSSFGIISAPPWLKIDPRRPVTLRRMDAWLGLTAKPKNKKAGAASTKTARRNKKNKKMRALEKRQAAQNAENQPIPANSKRRRQASCKSNGKQKQQLKLSFAGGGQWCLGTSAVAKEAAGSTAAAGEPNGSATFSIVATSTSSDTAKSTPMTFPVAGCDASTIAFEEDAKGLHVVDDQQPASAPDQHPISSTAPPVPISSPSAQPSSRI